MTFYRALTLLFIYLQLTSQIHWSWWWVLAPMWIGFSLELLAKPAEEFDAWAKRKRAELEAQ
jgi:hypothetical protein